MDAPDPESALRNFRENEVFAALVRLGLRHIPDGTDIYLLGVPGSIVRNEQLPDRIGSAWVKLEHIGRVDEAREEAGQRPGVAVCEQGVDR
jgi:hypothetical protein